jgi:hypothetical protein
MPKIIPRAPPVTGATTGSNNAHRPAAPPTEPASTGTAGWSNTPAASATERREKATGVSTAVVELSDSQRAEVVKKKATCPFVGTAVATGALPVRNSPDKPLASIDDMVKLGNTGKGSDLGDLMKIFAQGNHAFMPGMSGKLDKPVPDGTLSLDLSGSQGSHPGHSGILQGDPTATNSGRFSETDFAGLMKYAKNGYIKRSDIGKFIAENVAKDPNAHAPGLKTAALLVKDLGAVAGEVAHTLKNKAKGTSNPTEERKVYEKLTKLLGEDNLIGSAGEFGLMSAFLANSPNTKSVRSGLGHEPAYSVADLTAMFKDKQFPPGWETWKKTTGDWVANTTALAIAAEKETVLRKFR